MTIIMHKQRLILLQGVRYYEHKIPKYSCVKVKQYPKEKGRAK
jgi:hypothetical protein